MEDRIVDKSEHIIIVGAGTWGCSTALHLARRGYTNITAFDPFPIPSAVSAGNDINKVVEAGSFSEGDEETAVAKTLLAAAIQGWTNDPVFAPYFHDVGYVLAASSPEAVETTLNREIRHHRDLFTDLNSADDFRSTMPEGVLTGKFAGWKGWHRKRGVGWVHARKAMKAAFDEASRLGVRFIVGNAAGAVTRLLYEEDDVRGVITGDGKSHLAARVILAAGAYATEIFDFENQLRPTAWTLAHIAMTEDEARLYKNLPVLFHSEKGFFMEPDEDRRELKVCDEYPGYCNWITTATGRVRSRAMPRHQIPVASAERIRAFLTETVPQLANRPFTHTATLWCADTPNRAFLITAHPKYKSLIVAAGDSGHGFTHITSIGGFIIDCMNGCLAEDIAYSWRWRPEAAKEFWGNETLGRSGAEGRVLALNEESVNGWVGPGSTLCKRQSRL